MALRTDKNGQLYTIEGIIASVVLLSVLLFVIQANSVVVPQTEKIADMKLQQKANDILTCIDTANNTMALITNGSTPSTLKTYIAQWNGGEGSAVSYIAPAEQPNLLSLDQYINSNLPADVQYNLMISYNNASSPTGLTTRTLIKEGQPVDNSVTASRIISLNAGDSQLSNYWKADSNPYPKVVQVTMVCWYL